MNIMHEGRLAFSYSSHKTRERAEMALEDYYATGEVSESEVAAIRSYRARFHVLLWAE